MTTTPTVTQKSPRTPHLAKAARYRRRSQFIRRHMWNVRGRWTRSLLDEIASNLDMVASSLERFAATRGGRRRSGGRVWERQDTEEERCRH